MRARRSLWCLVLCLCFAAGSADAKKKPKPAPPPPTPAQPVVETADQEVERLSNDAVTAYKEGRYDKAIQLLSRAYAIRPLTPLLYNLAKSYDKLNDVEQAYDTYKKYVDSGEADAKLAAKAKERLDQLEPAYKEKKAAAQKQPETPPQQPQPPPGPTPEELAAQRAEELKTQKQHFMYGGIGIAAAGVLALGAGVALYFVAAGKHDDFSNSRNEDQKRALLKDIDGLAIGSTVLYIGGAVLVAASSYFWYRAFRKEPEPSPDKPGVTFLPWIAPTGAGGLVTWRF